MAPGDTTVGRTPCYTAASQNAPGLAPALFALAAWLYDWLPALNRLQTPQAPLLVASAVAGILCFLALLPVAWWLGNTFSQLGSMQLYDAESL
jgi:hypothetical protein